MDRVTQTTWTDASPRRSAAGWLIGALVAVGVVTGLVLVGPSSVLGIGAAVVLTGVAVRPQLAAYVLMGLVSFFEVFQFDSLLPAATVVYVGDPSLGLLVSPLEVFLVVALLSWLAQGIARRRLDFQRGPVFAGIVLFGAMLVAGIARGLLSGGDPRIAFWEVRFVAYIVITYFLTANLIRTRAQSALLMWVFLFGATAFAVEGAIRRIAWSDLVPPGTLLEDGYDHTDPIFLGGAILLVVAVVIFGPSRARGRSALFLIPLLCFTLFATERRAGLIGLLVAILAFGAVLLFCKRRAFFAIFVPLALVAAVYMPLYWNDTSLLGQPARAVQSLISPNFRDAASNAYRDAEKVDIRATLDSDQLLGVGFGKEFLFVVPLPDLSGWEFWRYEPHNNVFWVWLKTGILGFIAFLFLMGTGITRASRIVINGTSPQDRVVAATVLTILVMSLVVSYVDVALVAGGRVTAMIGMSLGVLGTLRLPQQ